MKMSPARLSLAFSLALLSAYLAAPVAQGQTAPQKVSIPIFVNYDFDAVAVTYAELGPLRNSSNEGIGNVQTTGSSANVSASGSATPFTTDFAGGTISVRPGANALVQERYILTRSSSSAIVLDTAVNWSGNNPTGYPFSYRTLEVGTGATTAWWPVSDYKDKLKTLIFGITQISLASGALTMELWCKPAGPWATPVKVFPTGTGTGACATASHTTTTTAAGACSYNWYENYDQCRVGVAVAADDAGDTGANLERVTAIFESVKQ